MGGANSGTDFTSRAGLPDFSTDGHFNIATSSKGENKSLVSDAPKLGRAVDSKRARDRE